MAVSASERKATTMTTLNRTAILVKPVQPFLDWLHEVDPANREFTLADIQSDATIYLIPDSDSEVEAREFLAGVCGQIFEDELEGWNTDVPSWPRVRDLRTFERWFEWSCHSLVADLSDEDLIEDED